MFVRLFLFLQTLLVILSQSEAKIYDKCDFAKHLLQYGIDRNQIGIWSCIAKFESGYNTQAINHQSGDYGILQISHLYWCNDGNTPGKGCGITCQSLLSDDIYGDVECAKTVWKEHQRLSGNGFTAWTTYAPHCAGDVSEYVRGCF